eukprot:3565475-Prymnesium_polylepis.1
MTRPVPRARRLLPTRVALCLCHGNGLNVLTPILAPHQAPPRIPIALLLPSIHGAFGRAAARGAASAPG